MTRKQALLKAIELLEKDSKNNEIVVILKELREELPIVRWSKNSILDSIQDYLNEHNNVFPPKRVFGGILPTQKTLLRIFEVNSMEEFREKYCCGVDISKNTLYGWYTEEDYKKVFIENYNMINNGLYVKYEDYNLYRRIGTPAIETIIKNTNCNSYNDLLVKCGIRKKKNQFVLSANHNSNLESVAKTIKDLDKLVDTNEQQHI